MTAEEILKIVGTGVVAAALTVGLTWLKETTLARRVRIYSAIQVAVTLEGFALACSKELASNDLANQVPPDEGISAPSFPNFPPYPSDVDWKSLPPLLMADAIAMPNDVEGKRHNLSFMYDATGDEEDLILVSTQRIAESALHALELASQLRAGIEASVHLAHERLYLEGLRDGSKKRFAARAGRRIG